ncbi:MAG: hypothetical protein GQF41_3928 [Candidatus Rifleibacterium amylolyticum]|nr:MAG: hypothetical protein GQF41_3928 [Candidatus Rifleibacterium amylolyticum]
MVNTESKLSLADFQDNVRQICKSKLSFFKSEEIEALLRGQDLKKLFDFRIRYALLTNYTSEQVKLAIDCNLVLLGVLADGYTCAYDRWFDDIVDRDSALHKFRPDMIILHLSTCGLTNCGCWRPNNFIEQVKASLPILKSFGVPVQIILPEPVESELQPNSVWSHWRLSLLNELYSLSRDYSFEILDLFPIFYARESAVFAARYWFSAKLPFHPNCLNPVGKLIARSIKANIFKPIKLIAVDLDNTLWGGVTGEDGIYELSLDPHSNGGQFIRFQRWLKDFSEGGGLLATVSKNNIEDARQTFLARHEMLLHWDDFIIHKISWQEKAISIKEISQELNIGLNSIAFIDDSLFERDLVRKECPEVTVVDFNHIDELTELLNKMPVFDSCYYVTQEDKIKFMQYSDEKNRKNFALTFNNKQDFLRALKVTVEPFRISELNIQRVCDLVGKTNQFNLTTLRATRSELLNYASTPSNYAYCFKTSDIYGEHGITGVLVAIPENQSEYTIQLWLQSCRVMGRDIEKSHFAHLISWMKTNNVSTLNGVYIRSSKNMPVEMLYPELGFELHSGTETKKIFKANVADLSANNHAEILINKDSEIGR